MAPAHIPWHLVLEYAAEQVDGGTRSFPLGAESNFLQYAYDPPNQDYQKLFFRQATVSRSQPDSLFCGASAGWLLPDNTSSCKPVFIAHSTLSAIWLLRKSLPNNALSDSSWEALVAAAQSLAYQTGNDSEEEEIPPSAQKAAVAPYKRHASLLQESPSKRTHIESQQAAQHSSPEASPALSEVSMILDEPCLVQTVTNNNRRAEQSRAKKAAVRAEQKMLNLGLHLPHNNAGSREQAAYCSIEPKDAPSISWILKQDVGNDFDMYHRSKTPYVTATDMLRKARSLGNASAQENAAEFLQRWRTAGSPFSPATAGVADAPATQLTVQAHASDPAPANAADSEFYYTYNLARHYGTRLATVHIEYRWAMAFLGRTYANKIAALEEEHELAGQVNYRQGRGKIRTEAQRLLLQLIYPNSTASAAQKGTLKNLLQRAVRWHDAAITLGWGSLCLMPHDAVTNNWVEKTLTVSEWHIWLELAKKANPDAYKASAALDEWLGSEGIQGRSISSKGTLCIEAKAPATTLREMEEVLDSSDDEVGRLEDSDAPVESQVEQALTPAQNLQQLSLLDLFCPVEQK
jgi:hypothetical protein